jgi:hypothetical protein
VLPLGERPVSPAGPLPATGVEDPADVAVELEGVVDDDSGAPIPSRDVRAGFSTPVTSGGGRVVKPTGGGVTVDDVAASGGTLGGNIDRGELVATFSWEADCTGGCATLALGTVESSARADGLPGGAPSSAAHEGDAGTVAWEGDGTGSCTTAGRGTVGAGAVAPGFDGAAPSDDTGAGVLAVAPAFTSGAIESAVRTPDGTGATRRCAFDR